MKKFCPKIGFDGQSENVFLRFQRHKAPALHFFPLYFQVTPQLESVLFEFLSLTSDSPQTLPLSYWMFQNSEGPIKEGPHSRTFSYT